MEIELKVPRESALMRTLGVRFPTCLMVHSRSCPTN